MGIVIVLIIIAVIIVLGVFAYRTFRIDVVTTVQEEPAEDEENAEEQEQAGAEEKSGEMVDLVDYFGANKENEAEEKPKKDDPDEHGTATVDRLTDLLTGRRYLYECSKTLENARNEGLVYCAVYFDYDRFRYINSLKGANTGDYLLTQTAQGMARVFPDSTQATRISADHFCAVFPLVDLALFDEYYSQLRRISDKIRDDINSKSALRISVGFAMTDNDSSYDVGVLLTRANIARYCAKVTKSEKYEMFEESMVSSGFYGDTLMENYSDCVYDDDFTIYFDRQVDLISNRVVGCDTVARWNYDDTGVMRNHREAARLPSINDKVIYQSCRSLSRLRKAARSVDTLFVDLSEIELFKTDIDEFLGRCLAEFQIDPNRIALKVAAAAIRMDWTMCSKQFKKLNDLGVSICVCGIDTAYSNLNFLNGLTVGFIKLQASFAHGVDKNETQQNKCRHMIGQAHSIGAKAIFEGVHDVETAQALKAAGAGIVQGRFSGPYATVDDLIRELPEHIERKISEQTVILDERQLAKGEWGI